MPLQETVDLLPKTMNMTENLTQMERGLDEDLNTKFANERSRTVKICMLKHRCILMFSFMLISILQFLYIVFNGLMNDSEIKDSVLELVKIYSKSSNMTLV